MQDLIRMHNGKEINLAKLFLHDVLVIDVCFLVQAILRMKV